MAGAIVEQAGAIVFRVQRGSAEVLIVRAKKQPDDWIFPKGHIERDERREDAALREAREEAGVVGRILRPVCPPLEFASGSERVRVQYYLIVAHPLIVFTLAIVAAIGYLTFVRVVTRNLASDSFKRSLNRIRRYFVPGPEDPRGAFLAFDPFKLDVRPRPSWRSIGRGGWLETVVLVESVIVGGLTAMLVPTAAWWQDGIIAAITAFVSWVFLLRDATRRYADKRQFKPC